MKAITDEFGNNQSIWFRAGFAAFVNFQDSSVPLRYDLNARAEWRRGYKYAKEFLEGDGDDDDGGLL